VEGFDPLRSFGSTWPHGMTRTRGDEAETVEFLAELAGDGPSWSSPSGQTDRPAADGTERESTA
jgi:hypothetical protein